MQSVIINKEKRHAFVKMLTRELAIEAKRTMGEYKSGGLALRVSHQSRNPLPCALLPTSFHFLQRNLR